MSCSHLQNVYIYWKMSKKAIFFNGVWEEILKYQFATFGPSLVVQMVKNVPAMWETWVQYLGQEDPLEKEMATHSNILTWTEELGRLQSIGSQNQT